MNSAGMFTKSCVSGSNHNVGGDIGFTSPKDVPGRARKIREQATVLRGIAERLDRRASELEKRRSKGKIIDFLRRYLQKEAHSKPS